MLIKQLNVNTLINWCSVLRLIIKRVRLVGIDWQRNIL